MSENIQIQVPDIGDFSDVPVIEISVSVGERVNEGDTVIVVESDKATLDVPCSAGGIVTEIGVAVDDLVSEGSVILTLESDAGLSTENEGSGSDIATTNPTANTDQPAVAAGTSKESRQSIPETVAVHTQDDVSAMAQAVRHPSAPPVYASPSVRRLARELGVELTGVTGSGQKQRILRADVKAYVKSVISNSAAVDHGVQVSPVLAAIPDWPAVDYQSFGEIERKPLSRISRISGPSLARNAMLIPHVTHFDKADVTDLESFRETLNKEAEPQQAKITMLSFALKAVVSALQKYPHFNASLDGNELVIKHYRHIGIAVDTKAGLLVPVIKNADRKSLREIADEMAFMAESARRGKLKPEDMQGATFTISSLGGIGGTNFTPIINAPEVAILGLPRSEIQPVWDGQQFQPRRVQPLSLSFDHRVNDGVAAARFTSHISDVLNDFRRVSV